MLNEPFEFDWDEAKNLANQEKHGVSFEDAQHVFDDANRITRADIAHSQDEERHTCIGLNREKTDVLTVRFTYRDGCVRIFGAGYWRKQRKQYEQTQLLHQQ